MTNTVETGHAKNVTNFDKLILFIESMGQAYNPAKESLSMTSVKRLAQNAHMVITTVNVAEASHISAIDERVLAFNPLQSHITRIKNALKASASTSKIDESVETIFRKLQGRRHSVRLTEEELAKLEAEGKKVKQNSNYQLSYTTILENFDKLLTMLEAIPEYTPNEEDLKLDALHALQASLTSKQTTLEINKLQHEKECINRDVILYSSITGLVDIAADIKSYVKSVYGATSPLYKQISDIPFRNLAKK